MKAGGEEPASAKLDHPLGAVIAEKRATIACVPGVKRPSVATSDPNVFLAGDYTDPEYPPTLLLHGTEDRDVPYQLSADMAKELARHKVPCELVTVTGAGYELSGSDKSLVADAHAKALAFIRTHMKGVQ